MQLASRISGLAGLSDVQPSVAAVSPPTVHRTIIDSGKPVVSVQFAEPDDDGRWFMNLNWIVDSGLWADLPDPARSVLMVLSRHRRPIDSVSMPSIETLVTQSGFSRPGVYKALQVLANRSVIRRLPNGAWEMFPGRAFAGRREPSGSPDPAERRLPLARVYPRKDSQSPQGDTLSPAGDTLSPQGDTLSPAGDTQSPGRDSLLRLKTKDDVVVADDFEALVRKRLGESNVPVTEAARLIAQYGAERVNNALQNALYMQSVKRIKTTLKATFYYYLKAGYPLFDEIVIANQKAESRAVYARVKSLPFGRYVSPQDMARLQQQFPNPAALAKSGILAASELSRLTDAQIAALVIRRLNHPSV